MKFSNIQILRALAAGLVVYVHALETYSLRIGNINGSQTLDLGDLGVKLFFCISGFIIFNSSSKLPGGFHSSLEFLFKRFIRIIPLYWIATLIYSLKLALQGNSPSVADLIRSLLFIPYANSEGWMRPVLGQGWTLNFEMVFYIMTAMILLSRSRLRYYALIIFLAIAVVSNNWLPNENASSFMNTSLITTKLLMFFIGGLVVGMYSFKASQSLKRPPFGKLPPLVVALASLVVAGIVSIILSDTKFENFIFWIELLCCTFAVYAAAIPDKSEGFSVGRLLGLLVIAGDGSYSTYLLHGFIMGPAARLIAEFNIYLPVYVFASLMVIICTIVGVYCYKYFELPVQRNLSRFWNVKSGGVKKNKDLKPCVGSR